jgi:uncharacterized protein with ParB-like and HNH nuclease domain/predicted transport protein
MQATEANLLKFLKKSPQFVIPIYQRNYSWTKEECKQLWSDLLRAGRDNKINAHFIGSIVYVEPHGNVICQEPLQVIDGQQRLTTVTLLISALAQHMETKGVSELLDTFSTKKLRNYYLLNPDEDGELHFKLILSETDKDTLLAILKAVPMPTESSIRITENLALFQDLILLHHDELEAICKGIAKLVIVDVSLDRTQDKPQLIFESLNSTGRELSQADLIRNFILMGLERKPQAELYKTYWRPMEKGFGQAAYPVHFDPFMRHYLTAKTGKIPNMGEVYTDFKKYANDSNPDIRDLVADIHAYATYYCAMALDAEQDPSLKQAFHDLRELQVDVAYPFLLDAYHDYKQERLSVDELVQIVRLVESYVFRRAICAIPTNSLNKTFAGMAQSLKKDRYLESVHAAFLMLPSYRRFPRDEEFQDKFKCRDLYHFRSCSYWLRRLENHGRKERESVKGYTIEHIMPQNEALSTAWQDELGPEWQRIQQSWLHTLGNLTLTGYNSEYRDHPFIFKRDQVKDKNGDRIGFAHSPLRLNQQSFEIDNQQFTLGSVPKWTEDSIKARSNALATKAISVWHAPKLDETVLDAYKNKQICSGYGIGDHPHLSRGVMRELFDSLRQAVLELDPCVSEEFLEIYVAYKSETNFVDVVPQAKRLRLSLNMPFHEVDDPKNLCRDVSDIGTHGNGDVEVCLTSKDDLPYVMSLIRQSFDRQMGNLFDN